MWRSYMGQPRSKQGQCPRQTARNHNKNRQHSLRFKWTLLFRPHRLGVLSRLLQRAKRKKHMQTVCLKSVCASKFLYACERVCVCECVCDSQRKNVDKLLAAATFPCRCHSARCQFTFSSSFHCCCCCFSRLSLCSRLQATCPKNAAPSPPAQGELSRLKQRRNFAAFQVESVAKVFGQQRKLHAERTR